jgi:hypothetical protein
VTAQGSAYARFRRALDTGNVTIALAAAAELDFVSRPDALELVLLLIDEPAKFRRAALRWHARYCADVPEVGFEEAQAVLACLAGLAGRRPKPAACALARARQPTRPRASERGAVPAGRVGDRVAEWPPTRKTPVTVPWRFVCDECARSGTVERWAASKRSTFRGGFRWEGGGPRARTVPPALARRTIPLSCVRGAGVRRHVPLYPPTERTR